MVNELLLFFLRECQSSRIATDKGAHILIERLNVYNDIVSPNNELEKSVLSDSHKNIQNSDLCTQQSQSSEMIHHC